MFCTNCGKEMTNGVCPNCGMNAANSAALDVAPTGTLPAETAENLQEQQTAQPAQSVFTVPDGQREPVQTPQQATQEATTPFQGQPYPNTNPYQQPYQPPLQGQQQPDMNYAVQGQQGAPSQADYDKAIYRAAAKKYWYCFFFPILFFIPILKDNKLEPGSADVANNVLWIFILNFATTFLYNISSSNFFTGIFGLLSTVCSIFALVAFICAACGKGIKVPFFEKIKIIK